jgi:hydrogenase expression/formation protein HypC
MCLGIPGEVVSVEEKDGLRFAGVRFDGVVREVCLEFTPEVAAGDFVVVHYAFAIARVDRAEAEQALAEIARLGWSAGPGPQP